MATLVGIYHHSYLEYFDVYLLLIKSQYRGTLHLTETFTYFVLRNIIDIIHLNIIYKSRDILITSALSTLVLNAENDPICTEL